MKIGLRTWILIVMVLLSLLMISPTFEKGVVIKSVETDTLEYNAGLREGMIIKEINDNKIENLSSYTSAIEKIFSNTSENIKVRFIIKDKKTKSLEEIIIFTNTTPKITVSSIPKTKIKLGLDLQGGARALVKPSNITLTTQQIDELISIMTERFNVYGISDITIRPVLDLEGNNYILVEIAGATPSDIEDLISKQGKFEGKIGEDTVFVGGKKDIVYVCRNDARCAGITSCSETTNGYVCRFQFSVTLSDDAAQRHADITSKLDINVTEEGKYLSKKLDLYIDDKLVDSLWISSDLKGKVEKQVSVSGSGVGKTREEAITNAKKNMNKLQTILITGSLPYQLEIVKIDTISPLLGQKFLRYVILAAFYSLITVSLIILFRYKKIKISLAILLTSFSEIIIILGIAAFIKWNLDLPSIAGILITIGTGVDQQVIIIDEFVRKKEESILQRIKKALFIIFGAYSTTLASLLPLYGIGGGLLRGFAFTTIIGITVGILITRPAFSEIIGKIEK